MKRSKERFGREYAKLNAFHINQKFFTDEGLKDRQSTLKFKFFVKKACPELKTDADLKKMDVHKKALNMMLFHNQKVNTIQNGYKQECEEKARAKEAGLTLQQLRDKENDANGGATKDKKKMMKKFGKKNDFEVEIVMKGKDGVVENFDEAEQEDAKADDGPVVIQAENTLDMLMGALGGAKAPAKKKKVAKKAAVKKKTVDPMDTATRFFNNYGENPHL
jgi:hypothetical protein